MGPNSNHRRIKKLTTGLQVSCPFDLNAATESATKSGFHFLVTHIIHPNYLRGLNTKPQAIGRTDLILESSEWNRHIIAEVTETINLDSKVEAVERKSRSRFLEELDFAVHLGVPVIKINLKQRLNANLARLVYQKLDIGFASNFWISVPLIHPSKFSPIAEEKEDTWQWWDDFRTHCHYNRNLGLVLELSEIQNIALFEKEIDRWVEKDNEVTLKDTHKNLVLKFLSLGVLCILKSDTSGDLSVYNKYLNSLAIENLPEKDANFEFVEGYEDYLKNPLQPLAQQLGCYIYEHFERDPIKYTTYQAAIQKAVEDIPKSVDPVVIMVMGAGRGPFIQAALNVSHILQRNINVYALDKNPYAMNTLVERNHHDWSGKVILVNEDMRVYESPEQADIFVSEMLGPLGDDQLCPECLDGAQRFLKKTGVSIPSSYTSFLAPLQSLKIFNEVRSKHSFDRTLQTCYETPFIVHLVNYYQIAPAEPLFTFDHPNWSEVINNERYKKLSFKCSQNCVLTAFVGFFDAVLYKDVMMSIRPQSYKHRVTWFPIVFPIGEPVKVKDGDTIELSFWRVDSKDRVWYEWCLEAPVKGSIMNSNGRSYFMRKF